MYSAVLAPAAWITSSNSRTFSCIRAAFFTGNGALLLKHDRVEVAFLDPVLRVALVPVRPQSRPADGDQLMLQMVSVRFSQSGDQTGQVIARGEAIADEENVERQTLSWFGHGFWREVQRGCSSW